MCVCVFRETLSFTYRTSLSADTQGCQRASFMEARGRGVVVRRWVWVWRPARRGKLSFPSQRVPQLAVFVPTMLCDLRTRRRRRLRPRGPPSPHPGKHPEAWLFDRNPGRVVYGSDSSRVAPQRDQTDCRSPMRAAGAAQVRVEGEDVCNAMQELAWRALLSESVQSEDGSSCMEPRGVPDLAQARRALPGGAKEAQTMPDACHNRQ